MDVLDLEVSVTHGDVPEVAKQYAADKVAQLARFTRRPIVYALLRLSLESNRAIERPAVAEATLDLGGQIVRAHVAARDPMAAIDLLDDRLRRRLERQARRRNNAHHQRSSNGNGTGWRHGDMVPIPNGQIRPIHVGPRARRDTGVATEPEGGTHARGSTQFLHPGRHLCRARHAARSFHGDEPRSHTDADPCTCHGAWLGDVFHIRLLLSSRAGRPEFETGGYSLLAGRGQQHRQALADHRLVEGQRAEAVGRFADQHRAAVRCAQVGRPAHLL